MMKKNILILVFIGATFHSGAVFASTPSIKIDTSLLEKVQKQTFKYFWDFAHPVSGMARERSNVSYGYGPETVTTGGTGFGVMSVIVAADRKWITRDTAAKFLLKMVNFLLKANSYHGVWQRWMMHLN